MSETSVKNCRCGLPARNKIVYQPEPTGEQDDELEMMGCEHCDYVCPKGNCPRCKSLNNLELDVAHYKY